MVVVRLHELQGLGGRIIDRLEEPLLDLLSESRLKTAKLIEAIHITGTGRRHPVRLDHVSPRLAVLHELALRARCPALGVEDRDIVVPDGRHPVILIGFVGAPLEYCTFGDADMLLRNKISKRLNLGSGYFHLIGPANYQVREHGRYEPSIGVQLGHEFSRSPHPLFGGHSGSTDLLQPMDEGISVREEI